MVVPFPSLPSGSYGTIAISLGDPWLCLSTDESNVMVPVFPFLDLVFAFLPLSLPLVLSGSPDIAAVSSPGNLEFSLSANGLNVRVSFLGVGFADILHIVNQRTYQILLAKKDHLPGMPIAHCIRNLKKAASQNIWLALRQISNKNVILIEEPLPLLQTYELPKPP